MLYLLSISEVQESNSPPDGSFQQCHDVTNLPEAAGLDHPLGNPNEEQLRRIEREEEGGKLRTAREPGNGTGKGIRDLCRLLGEESIA